MNWRLLTGAGLLWLSSGQALGTPFVVSDPWPATGPQPTHCVYQEGAAAEVATPVALQNDGRVYCRIDVAGVTRAAHSWQVWASNLWGVSAKVPFAFSAAPPTAVLGLRIGE